MNDHLQRIAKVATLLHSRNQECFKECEESIWGNVLIMQRGFESMCDGFVDAYLHGEGYKSPRYLSECKKQGNEEGIDGNDPQENK